METEKKEPEVNNRLEIVGTQKGLFGEDIPLVQFKNLKEKQELKERVKAMFNGEMIRSIITASDGNRRIDKLERQKHNSSSPEDTMARADAFGKKTLNTLSTFPEELTASYIALLSKEGDKVIDNFMGHNSRATAVLSAGRKYYGYDVHKYPYEFTKECCQIFPPENYELNLASSEKMQYPNETFDFAITCPPYADVEEYNKIYGEEVKEDLSSKNYNEFLFLYNNCLAETARVLKKGSFMVIVIGDKHEGGQYTSMMLDTIKIGKLNGLELHDINIYNRKSNIGGDLNYKTFILNCKRFPTIHEFILIFYKPRSCFNCNKLLKFREDFDFNGNCYCGSCYNRKSKEVNLNTLNE